MTDPAPSAGVDPRRTEKPSAQLTGQKGTWQAAHGSAEGLQRALLLLPALAVAASTAVVATRLFRWVGESQRLPKWDMAKYGNSALGLAEAVRDWDLLTFLGRIHDLSIWPPLFPLFEGTVFLFFGSDPAVARQTMVVLWALAVLGAFGAGAAAVDRWRPWVATLAALTILTGAHFRLFATLDMLEIPGLLLLTACIFTACRALSSPEAVSSARRWRWAWLCTAGLFFCKYNYGLPWFAALGLERALHTEGSWRRLGRDLLSRARSFYSQSGPWAILVSSVLLVIVVVRISGGFSGEIGGHRARLTSAGNLVYALYLLWLGRLVWRQHRHARSSGEAFGASWRRQISTWPIWAREGLFCFALPVGLWMLLPPHIKDFVGFVENRSTDLSPFDMAYWTFYPEVLARLYFPHPAVAVLAMLLALGFLRHALGRDPRRRLLALALGLHWGALLAHPYKLPRFATSAAFLVGLTAAIGLAELLDWGLTRATRRPSDPSARSGRMPLLAAARGFAVLALVGGSLILAARPGSDFFGASLRELDREHRQRTVDPAVAEVLDFLAEPELRRDGLLVLGLWDSLSPGLVEWHIRRLDRERGRSGAQPLPDNGIKISRRDARRLMEHLVGVGGPGKVAVLTLAGELAEDGASQGFRAETEWLAPVPAAFFRGELPYEEDGSFLLAGGMYRVLIFRRVGSSGQSL